MTATISPLDNEAIAKAQGWAKENLEPLASAIDHEAVFPTQTVGSLASQGYMGWLIPAAYGGGGRRMEEYVHLAKIISGASAGTGAILNGHALAAHAIAKWGDDAQRTRYLKELAQGRLATHGLYEAGPTPANLKEALTATPAPGGWTLSGEKRFIRSGQEAGLCLVLASLAGDAGKSRLLPFLIEAETPGLRISPEEPPMGLTASPLARLSFDHATVAAGAVVGGARDRAAALAGTILGLDAVLEAALAAGISAAALAHAARHAQSRVQFHRPVAAFEAVRALLADVRINSHFAWLAVQEAARLADQNLPFIQEAAMIKCHLARAGGKMLADCCQVEGRLGISETVPKGIRESLPLARMFRDIAGTTLLNPPWDFPETIVAETLLEHSDH